jgi:hypothetical protein
MKPQSPLSVVFHSPEMKKKIALISEAHAFTNTREGIFISNSLA